MTGYVTGRLADADGAEELLRTAAESLKVAEQLGCPRLNLHDTRLDDRGLPVRPSEVVTPSMWLTAARTLTRLAELLGRCEPGTGEINYPAIAAALDRLGYAGVVGLEGWASDDPERALQRFRSAFTIEATG